MVDTTGPQNPQEWHYTVSRLAVECNARSAVKYEAVPDDIVRSALWALTHDALICHQAVLTTVQAGWSSAAGSLARTLMDLLVSALAILNSKDQKLAAFRYFYSGFRTLSRDQGYDADTRRSMRNQIRTRIASLPAADKPQAMAFLLEKDRTYWFSDEWRSPSQVLQEFGPDGFDDVYRQFSAAAHGGFIGQRVIRDDPDRMDINPRLPVRSHAESVLAASTRIILELTRLRISYEKLGLDRLCYDLTIAFNEFGRSRTEMQNEDHA